MRDCDIDGGDWPAAKISVADPGQQHHKCKMRKTDEGAARKKRSAGRSWDSTMTLGLWSLGETIELEYVKDESGSLGPWEHTGRVVFKFGLDKACMRRMFLDPIKWGWSF